MSGFWALFILGWTKGPEAGLRGSSDEFLHAGFSGAFKLGKECRVWGGEQYRVWD